MLLNRIAMFLLMIMVFLTGFLHCLRLDTVSFLPLIKHILSDSDNSNNNNSDSSGNTFTPAIDVLDTSFNSPNGSVIQPIGSSDDYGRSLAIQPDGKILLGGHCHNGSNFDFCIARFNPNGTLDTTFGNGGKVIQPIGSGNDHGYSLAIQPDGKILLGGYCHNGSNLDFCIARFK